MIRRGPVALLAAAASLPLLAGCGNDPARSAPAAPAALVVELSASQFSPATIDAHVGERITFVNRDTVAHTATATAGARFDSGAMEEGATFSFTPRRAGVISLLCAFHPGMTGAIGVS